MPIKKSLKIFLSLFLLIGCSDPFLDNPSLPPRPNGWFCTHAEGKFYCNEMNNPDNEIEFNVTNPEMDKAACMPLETFERYTAYVQELKTIASKSCVF